MNRPHFHAIGLRVFLGVLLTLSMGAASAEERWDIQYRFDRTDSVLTLNALAFPTARHGIACGYTVNRDRKMQPLVLVTNDGGTRWSEVPVRETGLDLFFLSDKTGWMLSDDGLWFTSDGGVNWDRSRGAPGGMRSLWFLDAKHGFASGIRQRVFETKDGGDTWTLLPVLKGIEADPLYTTFGAISFSGDNGIISGWNVPPVRDPSSPTAKREIPHLSVLLETRDAGKTWTKSEASVFGEITRFSMAPQGTGLGLIEFKNQFDYPSEVYRLLLANGRNNRAFRRKDRAITDVRMFPGSERMMIAGYEPASTGSPLPGHLHVLASTDYDEWTEMTVDFEAVAHRAFLAGPDVTHVWIATDTGMILRLTSEP